MFLLIFLCLSPIDKSPRDKSLSAQEKEYILDCFKALNITEKELRYEKKWATDTIFRLKAIENLLDNPLSVPDYVDESTQIVRTLKNDLPKLTISLLKEAGLITEKIPKLKKEIESEIKLIKDIPSIFAPILASFRVAERYQKLALKNLQTEELNKILMFAPVLWGNDNTSLKGALHREFNVQIDTLSKIDTDTIIELSKKLDRTALSLSNLAPIIGFDLTKQGLKHIDFDSMQGFEIKGVQGNVLLHTSTDFGDFVIGGCGDNTYYSDFSVIIDPDGDDVYKGRAGGGIGILHYPFSILIDLQGNDIYSSNKLFNFGASIFGTGILFDADGNDTYRSSHYSLGAGLFGCGILIDSSGNDIYEAGYFTQGAGNFGIGVLLDYKGNDTYKAQSYAQAMAGTFGYGLLSDFEGSDLYYSGGTALNYPLLPEDYSSFSQGFAIGNRPDAAGGIGFLYDKSGNDFYNGAVYSQGVGYWYSLGMLVDEQGNDFYNAVEYAQGAGIHLAIGALIDKDGNDHYFSRFGPAQGEGHDLSVGFLIDKKGDDTYQVSGGQGIGLANGLGIFIDSDGNDTYISTEKQLGQGSGKEARGFPSSGIFLDLKGKDKYAKNNIGEDTTCWFQGKYGVGIDLSAEKVIVEQEEKEEEEIELKAKSIKELFETACLWEVGPARKKARKARNLLIEKGEQALDYIFPDKMNTKTTLVLRAIRDISDSLQPQASPLLIKCLKHEKRRVRANAIWVLGEIKDSSAIDALLLAIKNPENSQAGILRALGEIGDKKVVPDIIPYLKSEKEVVRIYACYAFQKLKDPRSITPLISATEDPYFTVRNGAENAILKIALDTTAPVIAKSSAGVYPPPSVIASPDSSGRSNLTKLHEVINHLLNALPRSKKIAKPHIIRALGVLCENLESSAGVYPPPSCRRGFPTPKEITKKLLKYLKHKDPTIRGFTVEALIRIGGKEIKNILEQHIKDEKDKFVLSRYKKNSDSLEKKKIDK